MQELSILMVQFLPGVYYIFFVKAMFFKKQTCNLSLEIVPVTGKDPLSTTDRLSHIDVDYSTRGYLTLQHLLDNKLIMDRIFLFTDGQMYGGGYGFHRRSPQECLSTVPRPYEVFA